MRPARYLSAGWIVLSTREPAALRDLLIKIGITMMSAGSHTEPGGYTGQGKEKVHRTVRGRIMPPDVSPREPEFATSQFEIGIPFAAGNRDPLASRRDGTGLERLGYRPDGAMTITLNGESRSVPPVSTIDALGARN